MNELTFRPITAADETDFYTMAEEFYHSDAVLHPIRQNITAVPFGNDAFRSVSVRLYLHRR